MATRPGTGSLPTARAPLNRERVLRAGVELADEGGIDALSMRRLGQVLGVEAMSLYNHVRNKDDLLAGMLATVVREWELPPPGPDWKEAIRRTATSAYRTLVRHRWACPLLTSRGGALPEQMRYTDAILRTFREAGFSIDLTHHAYHALDSHIVGFTLWQLNFPFKNREELLELGRRFLLTLAEEEYPYLAEHVRHHLDESPQEGRSEFEFGLDLVLDGLERLREAEAR
jgi:AcrR family transcriptional regulator